MTTTHSTQSTHEEERSVAGTDTTTSLQPISPRPVPSNLDLYATPPAYTQSIVDGETSVDAEAQQEEKPSVYERSPSRQSPSQNHNPNPLQQQTSHASSSRHVPPLQPQPQPLQHEGGFQSLQRVRSASTRSVSSPEIGHYLTEPYTTANLVGARTCGILPDRPAIWLVRRKKMALSPLAAAVLTGEGVLAVKDLELLSQYSGSRRDPTDPLSGLLLGFYDTISEMTLGLVAGPVELGRQATPMLKRSATHQAQHLHHGDPYLAPSSPAEIRAVPHAAAQVALSTGKGLGRIVTAGLKSPMFMMNGITRGFHNLPKSYGEEVREYENVTGLRSGLVVSAKSFGYGLGDGLKDLFAKPIEGAEQNGVVGFGTGVAKGLANSIVKPTAGACGLVGYSFVGVYKSIRSLKITTQEDAADVVRRLGQAEYAQASDAEKLYIVRVWCQTQMRVRLA